MCGIVGYIGNNNAQKKILNTLKKLEYRGYDSAGLSTINNEEIETIKESGKIKKLKSLVNKNKNNSCIGIGHTRWATHGKPNKINSHPHLSYLNNIAIVHNGIIENYKELKSFLIKNDITFYSETDSEVIANLICYYYKQTNNKLESIKLAKNDLIGSYAVCVIFNDDNKNIYGFKLNSPLIIGRNINENYFVSDIPAIISECKSYIILNDDEIAKIDKNNVYVYDKLLNEKIFKEIKNKYSTLNITKMKYKSYMEKEINEIPTAINDTLNFYKNNCKIITKLKGKFIGINNIKIIACGTSYNAGLMGKYIFESKLNIFTDVIYSSEVNNLEIINPKSTLFIFISQSGETADTILALKKISKLSKKTIGITNVITSTIANNVNLCMPILAGPEIAVASTKAYNCQVALLYLICDIILEKNKLLTYDFNTKKIQNFIKEDLSEKAKQIMKYKKIFFLGRNLDYNLCKESALKLKEITYINCTEFYSGELKHGPLSLIDINSLCIIYCTQKKLIDKTKTLISEIKSRNGNILLITQFKNEFDEDIILLPLINKNYVPIIAVIPVQKIALNISKFKRIDPDKPRNLAKSVTVE